MSTSSAESSRDRFGERGSQRCSVESRRYLGSRHPCRFRDAAADLSPDQFALNDLGDAMGIVDRDSIQYELLDADFDLSVHTHGTHPRTSASLSDFSNFAYSPSV